MINQDQNRLQLATIIPNLVDISYIVQVTGFTKAHIYNEINAGRLSKPIKFNRRSRWKAEDVANWINYYIENGAD